MVPELLATKELTWSSARHIKLFDTQIFNVSPYAQLKETKPHNHSH